MDMRLSRACLRLLATLLATFLVSLCCGAMPGWAAVGEESATGALRERISDMLVQRDYAALNSTLMAFQQAYERDTDAEQPLLDAFSVFSGGNPALDALLDEWVDRYPDTYAALAARGMHRVAQGWRFRGDEFFDKTPRLRIEMMTRAFEKADQDLTASLPLTKKPIISYQEYISIAMNFRNSELLEWAYAQALEADPHVVGIKKDYMYSLRPRWGGSYEQMRQLAAGVRKISHPKMDGLAEFIEASILIGKGDAFRRQGEHLAALDYYQQAHALHASADTHYALGNLYKVLGKFDIAEPYMRAVLRENPGSVRALSAMAYFQMQRRDYGSAMSYLQSAAMLGDDWSTRELSDVYFEGKYGQPINPVLGERLLEQAAYFLDEISLFTLGNMYEKGLGVAVDRERAITYYELGAQLKYVAAQNNLAMVLWYRDQMPDDRERAKRLWKEVADTGEWRGRHNLEFFVTPLDRLKLVFEEGPGMWALWPLLGLAAVVLMVGVLLLRIAVRPR